MAAKKKAVPKKDADQSRRFVDTARELEAAGELNLADAAKKFERTFRKVVPPKDRPKSA